LLVSQFVDDLQLPPSVCQSERQLLLLMEVSVLMAMLRLAVGSSRYLLEHQTTANDCCTGDTLSFSSSLTAFNKTSLAWPLFVDIHGLTNFGARHPGVVWSRYQRRTKEEMMIEDKVN